MSSTKTPQSLSQIDKTTLSSNDRVVAKITARTDDELLDWFQTGIQRHFMNIESLWDYFSSTLLFMCTDRDSSPERDFEKLYEILPEKERERFKRMPPCILERITENSSDFIDIATNLINMALNMKCYDIAFVVSKMLPNIKDEKVKREFYLASVFILVESTEIKPIQALITTFLQEGDYPLEVSARLVVWRIRCNAANLVPDLLTLAPRLKTQLQTLQEYPTKYRQFVDDLRTVSGERANEILTVLWINDDSINSELSLERAEQNTLIPGEPIQVVVTTEEAKAAALPYSPPSDELLAQLKNYPLDMVNVWDLDVHHILNLLDTEHVISPDQFEILWWANGWSPVAFLDGLYFSTHPLIWVITGQEITSTSQEAISKEPQRVDKKLCTLWVKWKAKRMEVDKVEPYWLFLKPKGFVHMVKVSSIHNTFWIGEIDTKGSSIMAKLQKIEYGSRYERFLRYYYDYIGPADVIDMGKPSLLIT